MSKKTYQRELTEWLIIVSVGLTLYFTGLHTEVIGMVQRAVLATGIVKPDMDEMSKAANYNFELSNIKGETKNFSEFRGKLIFLNFWATWCAPCLAEMPDIESLYHKEGDEVNFVMINIDEDREKAKSFIARKEFEMPIYFLESPLPKVFETHSIPSTFVIDPNGHIRMENRGMAKYDSESFREFLNSLQNK